MKPEMMGRRQIDNDGDEQVGNDEGEEVFVIADAAFQKKSRNGIYQEANCDARCDVTAAIVISCRCD